MSNKVLEDYLGQQEGEFEAGCKALAHILWLYYQALLEQGFTKEDALELTKGYQAMISKVHQ